MVNEAKVTDYSLLGWWADSLTCGRHSGPCSWCLMGRGGVRLAHGPWLPTLSGVRGEGGLGGKLV